MADKLTSSQRSRCMSRIRGKNTKLEILVRKGLHARGFRFRLHNKKLPGSPDIVLPKYSVAIMVNGCFWHGHKGCRYATKPKSNVEFWEAKIQRNRHRDEVTNAHLEALGWHVITVWECELRKGSRLEDRLNALAEEIRYAGELKKIKEDEKRRSRVAARKEREELLRKQAELETEINSLYPIPKRVKMDAEDMLTYN
ncbi:MAG: DNA mismatch endonuclease Vsr [Bacteroidales bacterium]|nr:DNA mismatch endonuclease Vsr [Bacteroidales bacterium]